MCRRAGTAALLTPPRRITLHDLLPDTLLLGTTAAAEAEAAAPRGEGSEPGEGVSGYVGGG